MKKFYVSSRAGLSGICKYSKDFYEFVLKDKGYIFVDSNEGRTAILTKIASRDYVHIEIGIFQKKEIEILFAMLDANYKNVVVTLHDAPLLKYPFREFSNPLLNKVSKFYDIYINKFDRSAGYAKKIKAIYVLSQKGLAIIKSKYKIEHVYYLPHIIDVKEIAISTASNNNFIYLGFIGKNKGIGYSLRLHEKLLKTYPDSNFYVLGKALGKENIFYNELKERYTRNVHFLGYVPEEALDAIFDKAMFSLMPFKDYKFFFPISGSLLFNLKKGKIIFTNKINSVAEIINDGKNGFYLSGNIKQDIKMLVGVLDNKEALADTKAAIQEYLLLHHTAAAVSRLLKD